MLQTAVLKPQTSLIEVARRFHKSPESRVIRARYVRGYKLVKSGYWVIDYTGPKPDLWQLEESTTPVPGPICGS